jgi:hypothetical protein
MVYFYLSDELDELAIEATDAIDAKLVLYCIMVLLYLL